MFVPTNPRASLIASNGVGQCLVRHVSQGAEEWSDVDHQDVLMCPR